MIKDYLKNNPKKSFQEAFDYTSKGNSFKQNWDKEFNKLFDNLEFNMINIIYIDKNYPPNTLLTFKK